MTTNRGGRRRFFALRRVALSLLVLSLPVAAAVAVLLRTH